MTLIPAQKKQLFVPQFLSSCVRGAQKTLGAVSPGVGIELSVRDDVDEGDVDGVVSVPGENDGFRSHSS